MFLSPGRLVLRLDVSCEAFFTLRSQTFLLEAGLANSLVALRAFLVEIIFIV